MKKELSNPLIKEMADYSPDEIAANAEYYFMMNQRHSILEVVQSLPFAPLGFALHSMHAEDRLGNAACDFPIGIVFGDSDFFGSEGSDDLIRNSQ